MRLTVAALFMFALVAIAQDSRPETRKALDNYCITMSKKVDSMDTIDNDMGSILPKLPAEKRSKVVDYLKSLRTLRHAIRQDACDAKDLKSARLATHLDLNKSAAVVDEMLAFVDHNLAEAYRQKAQSDPNPQE